VPTKIHYEPRRTRTRTNQVPCRKRRHLYIRSVNLAASSVFFGLVKRDAKTAQAFITRILRTSYDPRRTRTRTNRVIRETIPQSLESCPCSSSLAASPHVVRRVDYEYCHAVCIMCTSWAQAKELVGRVGTPTISSSLARSGSAASQRRRLPNKTVQARDGPNSGRVASLVR
jgi:hypothetical protein